MSHPPTAREALIAEMLGDMARVLDRVEVLVPALERARVDLADQLAHFEGQMVLLTEKAKLSTAEYIARRTRESTANVLRLQTQAMSESARAAFGTEMAAARRQLLQPLEQLRHRLERPWRQWFMCTMAAGVASLASSALTWSLMTWGFPLR
ncbi:hypothetical protein [Piscinibacter sp. HJYY11]|uniref:hypothetical protein n=1 Tax=Piscinibacter sp. HJYY11 TaxID=2801333 RepID=UPI00191CED1B|nr:hypothetical protein [Piscinibacter sp. HJYY11]MBL0726097.1 hypothetical protein [Piscinibacter sp. HJYY11]